MRGFCDLKKQDHDEILQNLFFPLYNSIQKEEIASSGGLTVEQLKFIWCSSEAPEMIVGVRCLPFNMSLNLMD